MEGGLREWLAGLTRREVVLFSVAGMAALGFAGVWYMRSVPAPVPVRAPVAAPQATPSPAVLIVHVTGWVRSPGVYELSEGDRVIDAIDAAGGPKRGAELDALNLAALLVDAQQVLVPKQAPSAPVPAVTGTASTTAAGTTLININTAAPEELETLPGIGEVLAAAIVSYREEHGPFPSVDALIDVSGIGEVTLEEIRELVTV
ncbi:MAG TPA: ComEA family DNA-binding protein [Actinomycetota bacterium]|nr:ComEA family DNA-binding protein [Actinomycetota bacterium]